MTLRHRVARLERVAAALGVPDNDFRRDTVQFIVMTGLSVGGLSPSDQEDTIERRWRTQLQKSGLVDDEKDQERLDEIKGYYRHGVASAGWVDRGVQFLSKAL